MCGKYFFKISLLVLIMILFGLPSFSYATSCNPNSSLETELSKILEDYSTRLNKKYLSEIITDLEKLRKNFQNDPLINFWEAVVYSNILDTEFLNRAEESFNNGWNILVQKPTDCAVSSFYVLKSHILRQESILASRNGDEKMQISLSDEATIMLNKALRISPENPAALAMAGIELARENLGNESHYFGALMMLEKAKSIIVKQGISKTDIRSWNQEYIDPILNWGERKLYPEKVLENISRFGAKQATQTLKDLDWFLLLEDSEGDGRMKNWGDGKALYYFLEDSKGFIWFRFELYNEIDTENPAISLSFDLDDNQDSGLSWYGTNSGFIVDKMVSVGPMIRKLNEYIGYNGITNAAGMAEQKWINDKQGNIDFYFDEESKSYFVGFNVNDLPPGRDKIRVIGSVGNNATWNDDIGDEESALIKLKNW